MVYPTVPTTTAAAKLAKAQTDPRLAQGERAQEGGHPCEQ